MIYLQLFFSFLQIGMFSFGGGYAADQVRHKEHSTEYIGTVDFFRKEKCNGKCQHIDQKNSDDGKQSSVP